jgi:hypothetical protein
MTAEVAVMNKMAIALAADSAVTVTGIGGRKIYNTVNKLFRFSEFHPVGIMVYGQSELMGIPWETIIKQYVKKLGDQKFNTLQEYAEGFISFLDRGNPWFTESEQSDYIYGAIVYYFSLIKEEIDRTIDEIVYETEEISKQKYKSVVSETINEFHKLFINKENLLSVTEEHGDLVVNKYKEQIEDAKKNVFDKIPISKRLEQKLTEICSCIFTKKLPPTGLTSGIVIAGFGEDELFPSLTHFLIEGVANDRLKYYQDGETNVTTDMTAAIVPFAQLDMIHTFVEGIHPGYRVYLEEYVQSLIVDIYPNIILESIDNLSEQDKKKFAKNLKNLGMNLVKDFYQKAFLRRQDKYVDPVINAVAVLPKEELAVMAESLVNITALKKKISMDDETVGGAIDVAVISKGDGFVWIKQK